MAFITKESSIVYEENGAVLAEVCFPEGEDGTWFEKHPEYADVLASK